MSASTETADPPTTSSSHSKPTNARLPSLNQLAAKLSVNSSNTSASGAQRPRLVASALRTGSTTSLATTATTDSMAVQAPSTRSGSPAVMTPTTPSNDSVVSYSGGEPLTTERLDKLNEQEGTSDKPQPPAPAPAKKVGYKNIPSLDAITARLAKARQMSVELITVDGSSNPPEAELIEDPKTPGFPMKAPEHPLQYTWTIYHDTKAKFPPTPHVEATFTAPANPGDQTPAVSATTTHEYEAGLTVIGEFDTVESFCRYFNWLKPPSQLPKNSNYHLFKSGIKPMWEDPSNAQGGKWVLTMKNNPGLLDRCWNWLAMALVGEELEEGDELCGAVVSLRAKVDRIQVWTRGKEDVERINGIGKRLVKLLDVSEADGIGLEFQYNTDDRPLPNKFLSIQAVPASSYRSSFAAGGGHASKGSYSGSAVSSPTVATDGGSGFGSFGTGTGIGGWRGKGQRG